MDIALSLSGLKCLHRNGASRKAGGSQEPHKEFTHARFQLEMTRASSNPAVGDWFQTPLHPVSSVAISSFSKESQAPSPSQFSPVLPAGPDRWLCWEHPRVRLAPPCPGSLGRAYWGAWGALKVDWPLAGLLVLVPLCPLVTEFIRGVFHLVHRQRHCSVFTDLQAYFQSCRGT